jgi:hypothetical protein
MTAVWVRGPLLAVLLAGLVGCGSSEPIHYHSLARPAAPTPSGEARLLIEVLPVSVPERVNRSEIVFLQPSGSLDVRATDQWGAPLSDEIGQLVDDALWQALRAADSYRAPVPVTVGSLPQYRLALHVERFDAVADGAATIDASWSVRRLPQGTAATCRIHLSESLPSATSEAAVRALSQASLRMAAALADSVGRLDSVAGSVCPADAAP